MKPAPFVWHGPGSVAEAVAILAKVGTDGKVLAGGQSLVPVLAMRLAEPAHLVDINGIAELDIVTRRRRGVRWGRWPGTGGSIGTCVRGRVQPLLAQALAQSRTRPSATAGPPSARWRTPTRPAR